MNTQHIAETKLRTIVSFKGYISSDRTNPNVLYYVCPPVKQECFSTIYELFYAPKTSVGTIILILPRLQRENTDVYSWD